MYHSVPFEQLALQSAIAERMAREMRAQIEREGFVQVAPGVWEKRDAAGELVATFAS